jgi:hypothetical protein
MIPYFLRRMQAFAARVGVEDQVSRACTYNAYYRNLHRREMMNRLEMLQTHNLSKLLR